MGSQAFPGHSHFMKIALQMASEAAASKEVPVGAVLVEDGRVIATGRNRRESTGDPTAHAEILALRDACASRGGWRLDRTTLYVTLEPCAMCAGAIVLARVSTVVFGASDPEAGAGGSTYNILEDGRLGHRATVIAGVMDKQCRSLLLNFFNGLR